VLISCSKFEQVKQFIYRLQKVHTVRISRHLAHEENKVEIKAIPLQAGAGPKSSGTFRLLEFIDNRHMKVAKSSALGTGHLYPPPRRYPWFSFLLEAESTPGP